MPLLGGTVDDGTGSEREREKIARERLQGMLTIRHESWATLHGASGDSVGTARVLQTPAVATPKACEFTRN